MNATCGLPRLLCCGTLQYVAVRCSELQCVAVCCGVCRNALQHVCVAMHYNMCVLQCITTCVCCNALQHVCVLQCVAVCVTMHYNMCAVCVAMHYNGVCRNALQRCVSQRITTLHVAVHMLQCALHYML